MSGPDIFISYSREDRVHARHFAEMFAQEGFSVWWDAALHSGETFDEVIEAELRAARAVVVLWSPRSVTSRWVRAEATLADRRNKLAPVIIEPCDRPIIFELTHTTDLSDWAGDMADPAWQGFVNDLHHLVKRGTGQELPRRPALAPPSATPLRRPEPSPYDRGRYSDKTPPTVPRPKPRQVEAKGSSVPIFSRHKAPERESQPAEQYESEATQFYTRSDDFDLLGDEFHCLEIMDGEKLEKRYVVSPLGVKIGRTAPADIILADNRVSRAHCLVELADDRLHVSDLKSTNGTFIDGERIDGSGILEVGSVLRVGNVSFSHVIRSRADV